MATSNKLLRLQVFADRTKVKVGETINRWVWIESEVIDSANIYIFYAKEKLTFKGKNPLSAALPRNLPITVSFIVKETGNPNILLYSSGVNIKNQQIITSSQQVSGIEVQGSNMWWSSLFSNSLSGVYIGALLTFITTLLNDYRQKSREKIQRKEWIISILPAQMEENRIAVENGKKAQFDSWGNKLIIEGYYTELQTLVKRQPDPQKLVNLLFEVSFLLSDYNQDLANNRSTKRQREDLNNKLLELIGLLKTLHKV